MRFEDGYDAPEELYSPECVEGKFSVVRFAFGDKDPLRNGDRNVWETMAR